MITYSLEVDDHEIRIVGNGVRLTHEVDDNIALSQTFRGTARIIALLYTIAEKERIKQR